MTFDESVVDGLVQPDQTTCGPSSLVAAHMLLDPSYRPTFATDVLALHRALIKPSYAGRAQLPWPRAFGTPPWAVAHGMRAVTGVRYRVKIVRLWGRASAFTAVRAAAASGHPCPLYVGDRWLPRHVVLALGATDDGLRVYNPASGRVVTVTETDYVGATLTNVSWSTPWYALLPDGL